MSALCSNCEMAPVVAKGICRRCYDATPERRASRAERQRAQAKWRRLGLETDPLEGWTGAHGLAVNPPSGVCSYRRASETLLDAFEVRRPGHPLAGKLGWLSEPRMWIHDQQQMDGGDFRCRWCRKALAWRAMRGKLVAHPSMVDQAAGWTPENTAPACWVCSGIQRYGLDAIDQRLRGRAR